LRASKKAVFRVRIRIRIKIRQDPQWFLSAGSGSGRAKKSLKNSKKVKKFHVLKCWMFSFSSKNTAVNFLQFLVIKTLDLNPEPHPDPQ
jgi:hypothetical protein